MTLFKLEQYDVLLQVGDGYEEHHVIIFNADRLAAEIEAPKYGLVMQVNTNEAGEAVPDMGTVRAENMQALTVWAALKRMGKFDQQFGVFKRVCAAIQDGGSFEVDPTQLAAGTGSPSASDSTGPASTGSPLTSTNA